MEDGVEYDRDMNGNFVRTGGDVLFDGNGVDAFPVQFPCGVGGVDVLVEINTLSPTGKAGGLGFERCWCFPCTCPGMIPSRCGASLAIPTSYWRRFGHRRLQVMSQLVRG